MAIDFGDGNTTAYYSASDNSTWILGSAEWCIGFWIRVDDNSGSGKQTIFSHGGDAGDNSSVNIFIGEASASDGTANRLTAHLVDSGGDGPINTSGAGFASGALTFSGQDLFCVIQRNASDEGEWYILDAAGNTVDHTTISDLTGTWAFGSVLPAGNRYWGRDNSGTAANYYEEHLGEFFLINNASLELEQIEAIAQGVPIWRVYPDILGTSGGATGGYLPFREAVAAFSDYVSGVHGSGYTRSGSPTTSDHFNVSNPQSRYSLFTTPPIAAAEFGSTLDGAGFVTADLTIFADELVASLNGAGFVAADLEIYVDTFESAITGTATVTAELTVFADELVAALSGAGFVTAPLTTSIQFPASLRGVGTVTATLLTSPQAKPAPVTNIDVSEYVQDLCDRATNRLLRQFQNSCVILNVVCALADEVQELYDAAVATIKNRTLYDATGVNLDTLGRIVGQDRILLNAANLQWFGFDGVSAQIGGWDAAPNWVSGASLFGDLPANDLQYRNLILGKIFKNHVKVGSVPELIQFARFLTGRSVSFNRVGLFELELIVPTNITPNDVRTLITVFNDNTADNKYIIPMPVTGRIVTVTYKPENSFKFDSLGRGWDQGAWALSVPVDSLLEVL